MKRIAEIIISVLAVIVCLPLFLGMFREMRRRI